MNKRYMETKEKLPYEEVKDIFKAIAKEMRWSYALPENDDVDDQRLYDILLSTTEDYMISDVTYKDGDLWVTYCNNEGYLIPFSNTRFQKKGEKYVSFGKYFWNESTNQYKPIDSLINQIKKRTILNEDVFEKFCNANGYVPITKEMANSFYRDLVGTAKANNKPYLGTDRDVAALLGITLQKANAFLWSCAYFGITERQGGFWIYE